MVATWAGNWPLMRLALVHTEPIVFVSLRMAGSIAILAPILAVLRRPLLPVPTERLALFWVGLFQVTGFLVFSIIGLAIVAPGRAIVLAYTMPLWAVLLGLGWSRGAVTKQARGCDRRLCRPHPVHEPGSGRLDGSARGCR